MSVTPAESGAPSGSTAIPITSLSVPELRNIHERVEVEVQRLAQSKVQLQRVLNAFRTSNAAITRLSESKQGDEMLLPLTESLYVNGRVTSVEKVIVDIGTGYYVEKTIQEGLDYCQSKGQYLTDNIKQVDDVLIKKQKELKAIGAVLNEKIQQQQSEAST